MLARVRQKNFASVLHPYHLVKKICVRLRFIGESRAVGEVSVAEFTALDRVLIRRSHRGKAWITPRPAQSDKGRGDKTRSRKKLAKEKFSDDAVAEKKPAGSGGAEPWRSAPRPRSADRGDERPFADRLPV